MMVFKMKKILYKDSHRIAYESGMADLTLHET